jgi:hypothetical protein
MTPEQRARQQIDLLLQESGWIVQDRPQTNLTAGPGVAIREALLKGGEADSSRPFPNQLYDSNRQIKDVVPKAWAAARRNTALRVA